MYGLAVARRPGNLERTFFQQVPSSTWYFGPRLLYAGRSSDRSVPVSYTHLDVYKRQAQYCARAGVPVHLCGLSLGGILALDYALDHPENVKTLVLIGTPHKVPKFAFALQNVVFRFLPKSTFASMAFDKRDTFAPVSYTHLDVYKRQTLTR